MNNRIRQIKKIKGSGKKEQLMIEVFKICAEINRIKDENKDNESLPVVMFNFYGHTNTVYVDIFYNGWHIHASEDVSYHVGSWSGSAELTKCYKELVKVKELAKSKISGGKIR